MGTSNPTPGRPELSVKSWQDFIGGCTVVVAAVFALWLGWKLPFGSFDGIGPGMMPRAVALLLGILGFLLILASFLNSGEGAIGSIAWRGLIFVLAAIVVFAFSVRPLGLLVAAPITILISSLSNRESKPVEIIAFSIAMTVVSIALFKFVLQLPIPLAPWLLGY
ncbi:MAG: tripartite tricarboxylate transporter TctB family protein [Xanthobacteraceae bacterium]|nr:tripartite tricarboxylate transporter TctB family protein [Xanthobacteraceae bacterium]